MQWTSKRSQNEAYINQKKNYSFKETHTQTHETELEHFYFSHYVAKMHVVSRYTLIRLMMDLIKRKNEGKKNERERGKRKE